MSVSAPALSELVSEFRGTAHLFRAHADEAVARTYELCAEKLETVLESLQARPLTLSEASLASGYSADHLGRLVRENKIPNAGRPGSPRIAQRDLPVKPGIVALDSAESDLSRMQIVRSAINEGAG